MTGANLAAVVFWLGAAFVFYTYFGYPILIALAARLRPQPVCRGEFAPTISIVLAAYNEADNLPARVQNLLEQDYPPERVEIVVVSDGSTDATASVLADWAARCPRVRPVILPVNGGKAVALNAGVKHAQGELIVFADARQSFAPDALRRLAENFADPSVGSVSGELLLVQGDTGVAENVGLYWRYEKAIRRAEAQVGSMLGATGAIYAIRRALWRPLPPGTLLDDFLTPMRIVLGGHRALFDGRALATDRVSTQAHQEFRRKLRTLAGNFQVFALEPALLAPWHNPATWFQVWSHKVFRLMVPWCLALMLPASMVAAGWIYVLAAVGQVVFYAMAAVVWAMERSGRTVRWRPAALAYTFVTLNLAAAAGLLYWLRDRSGAGVWRKAYDEGKSAGG